MRESKSPSTYNPEVETFRGGFYDVYESRAFSLLQANASYCLNAEEGESLRDMVVWFSWLKVTDNDRQLNEEVRSDMTQVPVTWFLYSEKPPCHMHIGLSKF